MKKNGFTLIEVLVATMLLGLSLVVLIQSQSSSLYNSSEAQNLAIATQLLQKKTTDMEFYFQIKVNNGDVKNVVESLNGNFEEPYQDYKWRAELRESALELKKDNLKSMLVEFGMEESQADVEVEQKSVVLGNVNKVIKENFGTLEVWVDWDRFGRTKSINVVTHIIPTNPKIRISVNPEVE